MTSYTDSLKKARMRKMMLSALQRETGTQGSASTPGVGTPAPQQASKDKPAVTTK